MKVFYFQKTTSLPVSSGLVVVGLTRHVCVKALPSPCRVIAREERRADGSAVRWLENGGITVDHSGFIAPHKPKRRLLERVGC